MVGSLPVGILFVVIGMEPNFRVTGSIIIFLMAVSGVVAVAKLIGSWMATRRGFDSFHDRAFVMMGVLPQGEIGILIAAYLFSRGLVNPSSFNAVIIVVIVLTMLTPLLMKIAQVGFNIQLNVAPSFTGGDEKQRLVAKN